MFMALFIFITMLCGTNSIPQNIPRSAALFSGRIFQFASSKGKCQADQYELFTNLVIPNRLLPALMTGASRFHIQHSRMKRLMEHSASLWKAGWRGAHLPNNLSLVQITA
jgi:hypothetical protein